jgi:general secretion pathway protein A
MYTHYFGLTEKPFSIAPDPRYLYMSALHQEALAHLLYGISSDGCFILLTGDVGAGKTTVCRCLLEQLPENTDMALILNPKLDAIELLASICDELEIVVTGGKNSVKTYVDHLNRYLLAAHARGRITALLIDEAQNLSVDTLEQLRLLTNLETEKQKLLKIILLGQPELRQLLEKEEVSQISQRITSRYHLSPLAKQDVAVYVEHRLAVAGGRKKLFSDTAVRRVAELSRGVPRLINVLCDRALLGAYVEGKEQVDLRIVSQAAREVLGRPEKSSGLRAIMPGISFSGVVLGLLMLVLVLLAASLYYGHWQFVSRPDRQPMDGQVSSASEVQDLQPDVSTENEPTQQAEYLRATRKKQKRDQEGKIEEKDL